jgi:flagellin-like hook-associated protein FlgL
MASLIPITNTRVSGLLARQRLVQQVQSDQLDLLRLQDQLSTGRRVSLPSEDAPAALRAISLQRLLERKDQLQTNVQSGLSFLAATDTALNDVAGLLGDIRGSTLGVAGTTSTQQEREAVIAQVNRALEQLIDTGNSSFRGRYLFAGNQTDTLPYVNNEGLVEYFGNQREIRTYADIDVLFASNAAGQEVFGGHSADVIGGVDLQPHVSADTLLSSLRGGRGVSTSGAVSVSDGNSAVVVDLSSAVTVGDVARLLEANPPEGRTLQVSITDQGLSLSLDATGGGNLTVKEVGSGKIAQELGILETTGVLTGPLVGKDVNPALLKTTQLDDLLGAKARARLQSAGEHNDLWIEAAANGAQFNGTTIQIVDDDLRVAAAGINQGFEYAQYDAAPRAAQASLLFTGGGNDLVVTANVAGTASNNVRIFIQGSTGLGNAATAVYDTLNQRINITVDDAGATTVQAVVDAINATGAFTATHDNSVEASYNPAAPIQPADINVVTGNTGNTGGAAGTLYAFVKAGVSTANDVAAAIDAEGTFRTRIDDADTAQVAKRGTGVVSLAATTVTAGGSGVTLDKSSGLRIVNRGEVYTIDFASDETVEDLLNTLNGSEAGLSAQINEDATGINIRSRISGTDFQIGENGGQTATQLGVRSLDGATRLENLNYEIGILTKAGTDFTLVVDDGAGGTIDLAIDLSAATTIDDVLDEINNHPANNAGPVAIEARLVTTGNGIEIVDTNGRPLTLRSQFGSRAAEYLGLLGEDQTELTSATGSIAGIDRNYLENSSVFTTLIRLREALSSGRIEQMERAISHIDEDLDRVLFARAEVGARSQGLEVTQRNLEDENVQLQAALSEEIDVDLVEAITNLTARQTALQASLQATANILQLSLLDFI